AYQDLRGKLTLGVQEARETIESGREQLRLVGEMVSHASRAYRLSNERLQELGPVTGGSISDVLQSLRPLETAQFNYLSVVSAYEKAQLRMLLLLGPTANCENARERGQ